MAAVLKEKEDKTGSFPIDINKNTLIKRVFLLHEIK